MDSRDVELLERGQRVQLELKPYAPEIAAFEPLKTGMESLVELVTTIEQRRGQQGTNTVPATTGKEDAREKLARRVEVLSQQAVGYAKGTDQVRLAGDLHLSYTEVRYGEEGRLAALVRELVAGVKAIAAPDRTKWRITAGAISDVEDALAAWQTADDDQGSVKAVSRLATVSLPALLNRLRRQLAALRPLVAGQRETDARWAELHAAFVDANKVRHVAGERRRTTAARIIKRRPVHRADDAPVTIDGQNYGPLYQVLVENQSGSDLLLWMAFRKEGSPPDKPLVCPGGQKVTLERPALGPETARYLTVRFVAPTGGDALVRVKRVVAE